MTANCPLSPEERIDWLRLSRSEGIGPVTFYRLLQRYGSASTALEALPELSRRGGKLRPLAIPAATELYSELERLAKLGGQVIASCEPAYPSYLSQIPDAPPILCVVGEVSLLALDAVAIVGARNASASGRKMARIIADALGRAGIVVVSGLARGIDTAAHEAALPYHTAAVVAGGVDHFYPPENRELQQAIASKHVLVSEMPLGTVPKAEHFPRRNRIISGLCRAVVVVEAAMRSGSLITARLAAEQGREVFAVPGSPLDPRCEGTNHLIKQGAELLTSADDVIAALQLPVRPSYRREFQEEVATAPTPSGSDADRQLLLSLLSYSPIHVDELCREARLDAEMTAAALLELEVAGKVNRTAGGMVSLRST
jgi:DNA processing protein